MESLEADSHTCFSGLQYSTDYAVPACRSVYNGTCADVERFVCSCFCTNVCMLLLPQYCCLLAGLGMSVHRVLYGCS